jgi:hypothetical protein
MAVSLEDHEFYNSGNMEKPIAITDLTARPARREDAAAIAEIYNQGIQDRIATFETDPRVPADIEPWFDNAYGFISVVEPSGEVVGYAVAPPLLRPPRPPRHRSVFCVRPPHQPRPRCRPSGDGGAD